MMIATQLSYTEWVRIHRVELQEEFTALTCDEEYSEQLCDRCDGEGYVTCDMGHEHECEDCEASGDSQDFETYTYNLWNAQRETDLLRYKEYVKCLSQ